MSSHNIHEAKTHFSRLVERAAEGETVVIAKSGKPVARLIGIGTPDSPQIKRFGFLAGQFTIPDDFNTMAGGDIEALFSGEA